MSLTWKQTRAKPNRQAAGEMRGAKLDITLKVKTELNSRQGAKWSAKPRER